MIAQLDARDPLLVLVAVELSLGVRG